MKTYEQELGSSFAAVLREADALYEGRGRLKKTYERLSARLESMGIPHSLVGGFALILHGVRRFTEDIDILIRPDDVTVLQNHLIGKGYVDIAGGGKSIRDAETGVRIDFVIAGEFPGDGERKPLAFPDPESEAKRDDGIRVIGLKTLIELKLASGMTASERLQDLADVQRLIQVHHLDRDFAGKLHPYVRNKFIELCSES